MSKQNPEAMTQALELMKIHADKIAASQETIAKAVATARINGASWAAIGSSLGISKQAAQSRYSNWIDKLPLSDPIFDVLFKAPQSGETP